MRRYEEHHCWPPDAAMLGPPPGGDGDRDDDNATAHHQPHENRAVVVAASSSSPRHLVLACADRLHRGDLDGARRAADAVLSLADPRGDAADRLAHHFARALARRVVSNAAAAGPPPPPSTSAYLAYNQIAPFLRFAHLTANQAILEAAAGRAARRVHIVDLDAAHGVQWPPLLQALAVAGRAEADPPPEVRITGAGTDADALRRTGDRLRAFAASLSLPSFRFHPLLLQPSPFPAQQLAAGIELRPDETLAVNCVLFLHRLRGEGGAEEFLRWVKSMNPAVVTIAEREEGRAEEEEDDLPRRAAAAMDYYAAVFDALEAMVPPGSADRLAVEREVLGREIDEAVVGRRWATRGFEWWADAARAAGMAPRPLSTFAVAQARFLLRLHYPSEGYDVAEEARGACVLRWQTRPLMSVSSWH
ncbi:hypothetical protein PR202_ga06805 [Eleusine coracana subsp. coracana]|uniref:Uncharacterized protein n=1 Tax=Eleusine coracana subsp. coracana TaxID=191504 RepID=A0AAV5BYA4_ELECO|nr:hypothetical protein QOZ80_2BG0158550 [Eleusine coracana subsp. coracana]GJM90518.1 hypothetical protein PR202_ga06805 [Eleusine coracana subsp. coracana]